MAYDIGPRIGIDGEKEFRAQLQNVSAQLKTLGSEMKVVTTAFAGNEDSMEALTAKNEILQKSVAAVNEKIRQQEKMLQESKDAHGENATQTLKWAQALNESKAELNQLENQIKQNDSKLNALDKEMQQNTEQVQRWLSKYKDAEDTLDDAGGSVMRFGDALKASFVGNVGANLVSGLVDKLVELGGAIVNLDEETAEYRAEQAMLLSSFEANGHGADTAKAAYSGLFRVIGDSDEATEASQLLGNLAGGTEDIDKWTRIAAGSWGKFGKSLPITNLIEAANEAAKTGKSVSALDDAINWSGGDAEAFAKDLAKAKTEEERLALITNTLTGYLGDAADAFYENNAQVLQARDNQFMLNETMAEMGEAVSRVKTELGADFVPLLADAGSAFADMLTQTEGSEERFTNAIGNLIAKGGEKMADFIKVGSTGLTKILEGLTSPDNLDNIGGSVVDILTSITDMLTENAGEMAVAAPMLLLKLGTGLLESIAYGLENIPEIVEDIKEEFLEHKDELAEAGKELGKAFIKALFNVVKMVEDLFDFEAWEQYGINWGPSVVPIPKPAATGLYTVPYDGFLASLHEGEMVLTRKQAEMIRANGITNTSMQNAVAAMVNGMQSAPGITADTPVNITLVTPDGDTLGRWLLPSLIRVADADGTPITAL